MRISPHMTRGLCRTALTSKAPTSNNICINTGFERVVKGVVLFLTELGMRHNIIYINNAGRSHGQTQKSRPKASRTQKHWYPQPSPRSRLRHIVPRESLLRFQRPPASALRDAATPPGGWVFCRGSRLGVWSLPSNLLSGGSGIRKGRTDGSGSQAARPQGGTQTVRPSDRTRADAEVFLSRPDHRRVHPSRAGEVRRDRSSPQPRTGDGGQKKPRKAR
jgi:hypothetical protein